MDDHPGDSLIRKLENDVENLKEKINEMSSWFTRIQREVTCFFLYFVLLYLIHNWQSLSLELNKAQSNFNLIPYDVDFNKTVQFVKGYMRD